LRFTSQAWDPFLPFDGVEDKCQDKDQDNDNNNKSKNDNAFEREVRAYAAAAPLLPP
jgi:hypothetical protein